LFIDLVPIGEAVIIFLVAYILIARHNRRRDQDGLSHDDLVTRLGYRPRLDELKHRARRFDEMALVRGEQVEE